MDGILQQSGNVAHDFTIHLNGKEVAAHLSASETCPRERGPLFLFTHGAGGGLDATVMRTTTIGLRDTSPVLRWTGTANLASRLKHLLLLLDHIASPSREIVLVGRSLGARVATRAFAEHTSPARVSSRLILQSYPLNGPKADDTSRLDILLALPSTCQVLFVTGTKDGMCPKSDLEAARAKMTALSWSIWIEGADHGLGKREELVVEAGKQMAKWATETELPSEKEAKIWLEDGEPRWSGWTSDANLPEEPPSKPGKKRAKGKKRVEEEQEEAEVGNRSKRRRV